MVQRERVLILGYGEMGHAMERLLAGRAVLEIWEKFPKDGFQSAALDEAAPRAGIVLFCLPTVPHREVLAHIVPRLRATCLCLSVAKGLDEAGQAAAQIFADLLGDRQPFGLLHGPMIAEEIQAGRYAFAQLGTRGAGVLARVRGLFAGTRLHVVPTDDIYGINWSVILKNVYAMAFGMADELQLGDNVRGYLAVTALRELDGIVRLMGGQPRSPYDLAGLGDLMTTATSEHSHHHELGRRLAREETTGIAGEGIHTLAMVHDHRLFDEAPYPLFRLVHDIVRDPTDVRARIEAFLDALP